MKAADLAVYREKLRRERTWRRALKGVWFVVTLVLVVIYRNVFGIDTVWVTCLCLGIIQTTILDRRRIDEKQFRTLMEDDAALRAKWYEEHDERMLMIDMRAGLPFSDYMNMVLQIGALVAMPLSIAVCVTLLGVSFVQTMASITIKMYWMRRMTGAEASEEDA